MSFSMSAGSVEAFESQSLTQKAYQNDNVKPVIDSIIELAKSFTATCPEGKFPLMEANGHIDNSWGNVEVKFKYVQK